jgi:pimeloyl-ACP methyl ester carboxylesterase
VDVSVAVVSVQNLGGRRNRLGAVETRIIRTDDGGGHLELHSFRPPVPHGPALPNGPAQSGVVVVHGTLVTDTLYRPFAVKLAGLLGRPVHTYNRRGRAGSSPQPAGYSATTEVSDLAAVMRETGSADVVAHSYGGFVALNAVQEFAGTSHVPEKLAVYDAAVNIDGSIATSWLDDFERSVNAGNVPHALAKLKRGMQPGTALAKIPEPILAGLMALVSRTTVNRVFRELMPSGVGELKAVFAEADHARDFSGLPPNTRFMVGAKSPRYYKVTAQLLHQAVPGSALQISPKCVHASIPTAVKTLVADISGYFKG